VSGGRRWSPLRTAIAVLLTIPFVYPFVFLAQTALRTGPDYARSPIGLPSEFTLANLEHAWSAAGLGRGMVNSLTAVVTGVVVCCVLSSGAAFWLHRHRRGLGKAFLAVVVGSQALPWVLWIIPTFIFLSNLRLTNNLIALGVVFGTLYTPFGTWFLWSYYRNGISEEVLEAAVMDGASTLQQLVRVVVPLSMPALGTVAALTFVWMWGDLLLSVILLQESSKFTVVVGAATLVSQFNSAIQESAAAALIAILPMLLVFLVAQRAIVRGFTAGIGK
jgi:ABC-type glycerol-3-phosphate transport system permease component